jgi:hypothetical protein
MPTDNEQKLKCNISNETLTDTQQHVLSKGLSFAVTPKSIPKFEIIRAIESSTYRLEPEKLNEFKANIKKTIDKHKIKKGNLSSEEIKAIQELQKKKNIVISKADKRKVVVVQNKQDYERKMLDILSGEENSQLDSDPTKGVENKVTAILKKAVCLEKLTLLKLTPRWSKPPHIYGLVKVHKPNYPIRPIVSSINSPCQHQARFLLPILNPLVGTTSTFILNSQHFIEQINNVDINEEKIMGSFDVVNLFTTTPVDKSLSIRKENYKKMLRYWTAPTFQIKQ